MAGTNSGRFTAVIEKGSDVTGQVMRKIDYANLLFIAPLVAISVFTYLWQNYQLDDALIYLRYIKNFQVGHGLVYNPGEKFNGLTSPLFSYLILAGSFLVKDLQLLTVWASAFFLIGAALFAGKLFSETKLGQAFTTFTLVSFGYFYSTIGMETSLFLLLIGLSLYLYKIKSAYFVIALALLIITRNEGIFLAPPIMVDYILRNKKLPSIKLISISLIIFLVPFFFNKFYYGDFLPATGGAKIGQGQSGFWGSGWIFFHVTHLYQDFSHSFYALAIFLLAAIAGAVLLAKNRLAVIAAMFIGMLLGFYALLNIPNYHWYYAPFFYFGLIFFCYAFERTILMLKSATWLNRSLRNIALGFIAFLIGSFYVNTMPFVPLTRHEAYAAIGAWIKANTPPNASIALVEIGTVGWYAERYIVDILGLTNKYNADYIAKGDVFSWLKHYQPDYILRHDPPWPLEASTKPLEWFGAYRIVSDFDFPDYALLKKTGKYNDQQIAELSIVARDRMH